jgi:predicted phosphodiesterase
MNTRRIGLIADAHCHAPDAQDLPGAVLDAFRGVELILALGDMGEASVLDRLEAVAAVQGTRGLDDPERDPRLEEVVAYGGTHRAEVSEHGGCLFVNPGSPTLAEQRTIAVLEIRAGRASAEILPV